MPISVIWLLVYVCCRVFMLRRPFRRVRLFLEFNWPVLFLSCHASIHPMAGRKKLTKESSWSYRSFSPHRFLVAFINSPPPLALNKVAPPPAPGVPISPRSTTPPSSPRKSTIVNLSNASTTSMVEKANPTVCIELLLHLEVRIRGMRAIKSHLMLIFCHL